MAEFKISRLRYRWRGPWVTATNYIKDDVIHYGGSSWFCIRAHTSTNFFDAQVYLEDSGDTVPSPAWVKMTEGYGYGGIWTPGTSYTPGTVITSGGNLWSCTETHESSAYFNSDYTKWTLFSTGVNWTQDWAPATRYKLNDVVRYNGIVYKCISEHTSASSSVGIIVGNNDLNDDSTAETWEVLTSNVEYRGNYSSNTRYKLNDLVKYQGSIFQCTAEHTSSLITDNIDNAKFTLFLLGFQFRNNWNSSLYYSKGDIVRNGTCLYFANDNNINSEPGITNIFPNGNSVWTLIRDAVRFVGSYDTAVQYKKGDLVRRGGSLWVALADDLSDGSTLDYLDISNWKEVFVGTFFKGLWDSPIFYHKNDIVYFEGSTYIANAAHFSAENNFPGDNGSGYSYWDLLVSGDQTNINSLGDLVTFNLNRDNAGDGSSLGQTRIPIGSEDQVLYVANSEGDIGYKTWGNIERVFHVRTNGLDDDTDQNRGKNYWKPFKTIGFALNKANDNYQGTTTIKVYTGVYEEVLPLVVPARTAVLGEELRSVTIKPNSIDEIYDANKTFYDNALVRLGNIISNIVLGTSLNDVSAGNQEIQVLAPIASAQQVSALTALIGNYLSYTRIEALNLPGTLPTISGSNTASTNLNVTYARTILESNKNFIIQELYWNAKTEYPLATIDLNVFSTEITNLINALKYDLLYPGNYKTVLAARRYSNKITGSQHEDMFYVRDATGVRNCTLKGLTGTLPAPVGLEPYSRPTGGAYVSLDPGWGPNDESTWITTRSCYVQNVTTFGYAATGQKIDGSLHNGGNKSIVSNDFTQVISDGVGAHVLNGGRAELVSVFTYYAHIGMFAEDGGIIRATNGNSSYGDYGAVSDGNDPLEVTQYAKVNTRNNEALVASALAGEANDYIVVIEFENAGSEYSTANYSIIGSGTGASVIQEEFRDNAIFEVQVRAIGSGYILSGNNAQTGNTTTITLAASDDITQAEILGLRIILVSGEGTGQYGYVTAYDEGTRVCSVARESDNQPGWDHVQPGTPSTLVLSTGTRYRFEPRVQFSHPGFTSTTSTLTSAGAWASILYGDTYEIFNGVSPETGTATFNVVKLNRSYTVTLASPGVGYTVNQTITILGSNLNGVDVEHDVDITVTEIGALGEITDFTYTGLAISGNFVLLPTSGDTAFYSRDGDTWTETTLPVTGNWMCAAYGANKFVALKYGTSTVIYSQDGINWGLGSGLTTRNWKAATFGQGIFVAISSNLDSAAISANGSVWTTGTPSTTLPDVGDSTVNEWVDIAYGANKFVAIANSSNAVAVGTWNSGTSTMSWTGVTIEIQDSSPKNWTSIAYGNGRFVAVTSTGDVSYSFNGTEWYTTTKGMPPADSSEMYWKQVRYGQGVFLAVCQTSSQTATTLCATSYDGIVWEFRDLQNSLQWSVVGFGNPDVSLGDSVVSNNKPIFVVAPGSSSLYVEKINTGARALGRVVVEAGGISKVKLWEPGSGYLIAPTVTLTDPNELFAATLKIRTGDGALGQPTFINRGSNYRTSSTVITITGDGYADVQPVGQFITLDGLDNIPGPGAQFYIAGRQDYFTAVVVGIDSQADNGGYRSKFRISPILELEDEILDDMEVIIREKYSQVRITGHDFLDVGTGNFEDTNYPTLYSNYSFSNEPQNEVVQLNGGRVFYTSTDQDGNFRAGELFAVEQATGIVTISADFFDLKGLSEIALGGVIVGGSGTVVREFSTDPFFTQNSNNVIPTQRAIKSYLESRLNIGGEDLLVPSIIAGFVQVGPNLIGNTAGFGTVIPVLASFEGASGISGSILAQNFFYRSFKDDDQLI